MSAGDFATTAEGGVQTVRGEDPAFQQVKVVQYRSSIVVWHQNAPNILIF